jgi:hypothetical protein
MPKFSMHDFFVVVYVFTAGAMAQLSLSSQPVSKVALESAVAAGVAAVIHKYTHKG